MRGCSAGLLSAAGSLLAWLAAGCVCVRMHAETITITTTLEMGVNHHG